MAGFTPKGLLATPARRACLVALTCLAIDQLTKALALGVLPTFAAAWPAAIPESGPFLAIALNPALAFGLGDGLSSFAGVLRVLFLVLLLSQLRRLTRGWGPLMLPALGMIVAGIVGNELDRLRLGAVTDFIGFRLRHGPALFGSDGDTVIVFNLADLFIIGPAVTLILAAAGLFGPARQGRLVPAPAIEPRRAPRYRAS